MLVADGWCDVAVVELLRLLGAEVSPVLFTFNNRLWGRGHLGRSSAGD